MRAVGLLAHRPGVLTDLALPVPAPGARDLLVRVEAISVNPIDVKRRQAAAGQAPGPEGPATILGWDAAGTVEAVGSGVSLFRPGDRVCYAGDITRPGCNSEQHLIDERLAGAVPPTLPLAEAAALPLTTITAWESLFDRMAIDPGGTHRGRTILIVNGAGGVGSIAIQLARLAGLHVIATASRPASRAWCLQLGAQEVVDHRGDLVQLVGRPIDYVAQFSGMLDSHWPALTELVAPQGRIVSIVGNQQPLAMEALRAKSASLSWELMFTRARFQTPDMIEHHRLLGRVAAWVAEGRLQPTRTDTVGPIRAATLQGVHDRVAAGDTIGKLVLEGW